MNAWWPLVRACLAIAGIAFGGSCATLSAPDRKPDDIGETGALPECAPEGAERRLIQSAVRAARTEILGCYESHLATGASDEGGLTARWTYLGSEIPAAVSIVSTDFGAGTEFEKCFLSVVRTIPLHCRAVLEPITVTYPFVFALPVSSDAEGSQTDPAE